MFRRSARPTTAPAAPPEPDAPDVTVTVTDATFLDRTAGDVAIVDFWASWCGPCRTFAPAFRAVAARHSAEGFRFGSCDVDDNPRTAAMVGVQSVPTIVAFDLDGNEIDRIAGVPSPRDFDDFVRAASEAR